MVEASAISFHKSYDMIVHSLIIVRSPQSCLSEVAVRLQYASGALLALLHTAMVQASHLHICQSHPHTSHFQSNFWSGNPATKMQWIMSFPPYMPYLAYGLRVKFSYKWRFQCERELKPGMSQLHLHPARLPWGVAERVRRCLVGWPWASL